MLQALRSQVQSKINSGAVRVSARDRRPRGNVPAEGSPLTRERSARLGEVGAMAHPVEGRAASRFSGLLGEVLGRFVSERSSSARRKQLLLV